MPHVDVRAPLDSGALLRGQVFAPHPGAGVQQDPLLARVFGLKPPPARIPVGVVAEASGSARNLSTSEVGRTFTNEGATTRQDFNLPTAVADLCYSFIVQDADGLRVTASTGDTIRIDTAVSAAAGRIDSTTIGSTVVLIAINATEWVALSYIGTWTVT